MANQKEYNVDSIQVLDDWHHVRKRIALYIGSSDQHGIDNLIKEPLDNAFDEFQEGYGDYVTVHIHEDCSVEVIDKARGIPVGESEYKDENGNNLNILTVLLTRLNSGGKFNQNTYATSSGLHGQGVKICQLSSEWFLVEVKRDGHIYRQKFEFGKPVTDVETIGDTNETGTRVWYLPDKAIFRQTLKPSEAIVSRIDELVSLNPGITVHYINDINKEDHEFVSKNGIAGSIEKMIGNKKRLYDTPFHFDGKYECDLEDESGTMVHRVINVDIAFITDDDVESQTKLKSYCNNINTYSGGTHLNALKIAYRNVLNEFALSKKLIKEPIEMKYYLDGWYAIVSLKLPMPQFDGQTKSALGNIEGGTAVEQIMKDFFTKNSKDKNIQNILEAIVTRTIRIKEADEAARKARAEKRAANKVIRQALPVQLSDCTNAGTDKYSEILLVEGNSASGSAKAGRISSEFQAVLGLRGKVLNVEKASFDQLVASQAIQRLIISFGTGFGKNFDLDKLRYEKVIILCFKGDTKVKMLDGTIKTFEELAEMEWENPGQDYWVYSCTTDGQVVPGKMKNPHLTQRVTDTVKITLDNNDVFEVTPEHKFMMRNGSYIEAKDLKSGMSLMPLNTRINEVWSAGREEVYDNSKRIWRRTHRMVMETLNNIHFGREWHVHYINENFLDNRPTNLEWKFRSDHMKTHNDHIISYNKSEKHRETVKDLHKSGVYKHIYWGNNGYNGSEAQKEMLRKMNQREDIKTLHKEIFDKYNHKVAKVEFIHYDKPIPMYCGTVEDYKNFAVVGNDTNTGIFCHNCDADVDGNHISALLITFMYRYMRELITKGYVYAAVPPLYRVLYGKNSSIYLKDDEALKVWKKKNPTVANYTVQRFKGLGEMNPEELQETVLNPANRILRRITVEDAKSAEEALEICMGKEVAPRRKFIEENAYKITDLNI